MGAMKMTLKSETRNRRSAYLGLATVVGGAMLVSACTKVPDAINPAAWYRSTSDFVTGKDSPDDKDANGNSLQADRGAPPPGADGSTPNLARVDDQMAQRKNATGGLSADTAGRKYAESVQRQDEGAQNSLYAEDKAPAAPQIEAQKAAPAPMPATPVTTANAAPVPAATATPSPTATAAAAAPDPSYGVDPGMRERLAQQLAEIQARAADQGSLLPSDLTANNQGPQTIIISSGGIETSSPQSYQLQTNNQQFASLIQGPVSNNGALPLPSASTKVATILFKNGSAGLDARDRKILADVARIQRAQGSVVRVIGHASQRTKNMDPIDHKQTNFKVSVNRANQVAEALKRMGISSEKILTAAVGDNHPLYLEVMPSGEAGNRRTEIYLSN